MSAKSSPEVVTIKKLHSLALTATKTELYKKLVELDRDCIRKREHIRNALTCTGPLQEIEKELNRRILSSKSHYEVPLERLTVHSDGFDGTIKVSGVYAPLLQRIKESYDRYVLMQLKRDESDVRVQQAVAAEQPPITESVKLRLLKLRVSKLETHYKLAVEECERQRYVLLNEKQTHTKAMESLTASITDVQDAEVSSSEYSAKVEDLQLQIASQQEAIQDVVAKRIGKVPISVCYQLEQCVREVELEIQKLQKRCEVLEAMVKEAESSLVSAVSAAYVAPDVSSKLWQGLQESVLSEIESSDLIAH